MPVQFEAAMKDQFRLPSGDIALMLSKATLRKLRRKEFLLREGEVCRYKAYVESGFLRTYRTKSDGSEHIMQFSPENSWTVDPESYNQRTPSAYFVDALEPTELLLWTKEDFEYLMKQIPLLKTYSENLISSNIYFHRQRLFTNISCTAEEKYDEFIKTHPGVLARVPLHMVASYLGVSRETLSRIRHAQVRA